MTAGHSREQGSDLKGIGFALSAFTFWVLTDTSVKIVGQSGMPPYEMVGFLGLFMAFFLGFYAVARGQVRLLRPHSLHRQVARASLDMTNNLCVVIALRHLTLTIFYILIFLAPIVVSMLSAIFLREGMSWKRALAIVAGFAGVVIAVHPWNNARDGDWIGFAACMVCVTCFSINMVWSRVLTQTETPESLAFCSGIVTAMVGFAWMALVHATPFTARPTVGLIAMGLSQTLGTLCFYIAVKHTSAANVSQYHYSQLVTGTLATYLVWGDRPSFYVICGGILIVAAGLFTAVSSREGVPVPSGSPCGCSP
jgi:drug/metabolite transporter (DMT)-like permease